MNKISILFLLALSVLGTLAANAQEPQTVSLVQTEGQFKQKELMLEAGKPYVFEVENDGVDHLLGFVIAPKGKTEKEYHVQNAYLNKTIADGEKASSQEVVLDKGEYVYFCPLNPTPLYTLIVE
ncbi:MAG: cupredoxin domain-containing protein [Ekhidna sp.]